MYKIIKNKNGTVSYKKLITLVDSFYGSVPIDIYEHSVLKNDVNSYNASNSLKQ